ncbi:hypothetical protein DD238_007585 [Peronospora effusa]|uniref:MYND-type domain-containing protein n=1 Tax=Peronospora effusa TaxID=542832 RepID=A0A3M6VLA6_9STRA|nr:hypothetical protein DD238_007585 [Peronospora effusa]
MRIVSDGLVTDVSGDHGRRVEASIDLSPGDLVLRVSPYAAVLLPELWGSHCHKCFDSKIRLSRCSRCQTAFYCSTTCQLKDWQENHRRECQNLKQLAQLGLRSDQVMDVVLVGRVLRRNNGETLESTKLVWYTQDMEDHELMLLAALAQKLEFVNRELFTMDEIVRMLSRFCNNNFSICDELLLELGAGCYLLGAMINHSCNPNCIVTFVPKTLDMEIRAMKPIKSGEEITQTYVDIALPRRMRQQRLQRKYHFCCECTRCLQPLKDPQSLDAFLDADIDGVPQELWTEKRQDEVEQALKEASCATNRAAKEANLSAQQQQQCIDALAKLAEHQNSILHRDSIARLQTLSALFSVAMERGSVDEASTYGEHILEFYKRVYSSNHPVTGLHLFTLGDLYNQLIHTGSGGVHCKAKSLEYLAEAQRILRITHGKHHRFVKMLADRLETSSPR